MSFEFYCYFGCALEEIGHCDVEVSGGLNWFGLEMICGSAWEKCMLDDFGKSG